MRKRMALPTPRAIAARLGGHLPPPGARVGLLGGSFNPAHEAHLQISRDALRRLGLDEVWWLVSPLNPLKPAHGMAPLSARLESANRMARHPRIRPSDLEELLGTRYSLDTLRALRARFPRVTFVWLIGADNLLGLDKWHCWQQILRETIVAVFEGDHRCGIRPADICFKSVGWPGGAKLRVLPDRGEAGAAVGLLPGSGVDFPLYAAKSTVGDEDP
jgi:nicotinic acid mononucleotide adenylyltransferase